MFNNLEDKIVCLQIKVLASLQVILGFFFFLLFQKKWVGRAMGNETFHGMALEAILHSKPERSARIRRNLSPSIFCLLKRVLRKKKKNKVKT